MEGQIVRTIKDFMTTKDGELCVHEDEYLQVNIEVRIKCALLKGAKRVHVPLKRIFVPYLTECYYIFSFER